MMLIEPRAGVHCSANDYRNTDAQNGDPRQPSEWTRRCGHKAPYPLIDHCYTREVPVRQMTGEIRPLHVLTAAQ